MKHALTIAALAFLAAVAGCTGGSSGSPSSAPTSTSTSTSSEAEQRFITAFRTQFPALHHTDRALGDAVRHLCADLATDPTTAAARVPDRFAASDGSAVPTPAEAAAIVSLARTTACTS